MSSSLNYGLTSTKQGNTFKWSDFSTVFGVMCQNDNLGFSKLRMVYVIIWQTGVQSVGLLTSFLRPSLCICASAPITGLNVSLSNTRFMTLVKTRRIVTKFNSFFKNCDKYRQILLKTVTFFIRRVKQHVCFCPVVKFQTFSQE